MRALFFIAVLVFGPACAQQRWDVDRLLKSSSAEIRLADASGNPVVVVSRAAVMNLRIAADRIGPVSGVRPIVFIDDQAEANAYVSDRLGAAGVAFTRGFVQRFGENLDLVGFVMAHEIGHLARQHIEFGKVRSIALEFASLLIGLALDARIGAKTGVSSTLGQHVANFGGRAVESAFTRDQEREADQLAVEWAHQAGFDVRVAADLFDAQRSSTNRLMATHPMGADRAQFIRTHVATLAPARAAPPLTVPQPQVAVRGPVSEIQEIKPDSDDPNDPVALGLKAYAEGRIADAHRYASEVAAKGDVRGQLAMGYMTLYGVGAPRDPVVARRWFEGAEQQGSLTAITALADIYSRGLGVERDLRRAMAYLRRASDANFHPASGRLAILLISTGRSASEFSEAFRLANIASNFGDSHAQAALGLAYVLGRGTTFNATQAVTYLEMSSRQGFHGATTALGVLLLGGSAIPPNINRAAELLQIAAEANNAAAKGYLGMLHLDGRGVRQNLAKADTLLQESLRDGAAAGAIGLALANMEGVGRKVDVTKAAAYLSVAERLDTVAEFASNLANIRAMLKPRMSPQDEADARRLASDILAQLRESSTNFGAR